MCICIHEQKGRGHRGERCRFCGVQQRLHPRPSRARAPGAVAGPEDGDAVADGVIAFRKRRRHGVCASATLRAALPRLRSCARCCALSVLRRPVRAAAIRSRARRRLRRRARCRGVILRGGRRRRRVWRHLPRVQQQPHLLLRHLRTQTHTGVREKGGPSVGCLCLFICMRGCGVHRCASCIAHRQPLLLSVHVHHAVLAVLRVERVNGAGIRELVVRPEQGAAQNQSRESACVSQAAGCMRTRSREGSAAQKLPRDVCCRDSSAPQRTPAQQRAARARMCARSARESSAATKRTTTRALGGRPASAGPRSSCPT
jgi:hypothetical protein